MHWYPSQVQVFLMLRASLDTRKTLLVRVYYRILGNLGFRLEMNRSHVVHLAYRCRREQVLIAQEGLA